MSQNQTTRYLKYAIGEIILVVIGILIALYINNKNQDLKSENKIETLFRSIQKDLSEDVLNSHYVFDEYMRKDSLKKKFLANDLKDGFKFIYRYVNYTTKTNGYDNLMRFSDDIDEKYLPLLDDLSQLYILQKENIVVYNKRIQNTVYNSIDYLAKNKEWFTDWNQGKDNKLITEYYKNDMNYKNEVGLYMNDLVNLYLDTNNYRYSAINIYKKIEVLLGNKNPIPEHMTYRLPDQMKAENYKGSYLWVDGTLGYGFSEKKLVLKTKDGILYMIFNPTVEEEHSQLLWYKDNIFTTNWGGFFLFEETEESIIIKSSNFIGITKHKKIK